MNKMKLTAFFAVMSMAAGVAVAQPPVTTGTAPMSTPATASVPNDAPPRDGRDQGQMGRQQAGPFAKIHVAKNLPGITAEQKKTLDDFMEQRKAQADTMREEMRAAMEQARQATDRQARQALMQPLRQKMETAQQEVDSVLQSTLTPEQLAEVNTKATDLMKRAGRDRMGPDDRKTSGAKAGKPGKEGRPGKPGKKGEKGKKDGKNGRRSDRKNAPADNDAATTGAAAANPFAT